ncbi:MAG: hypothetical protein V4794_10570, partial [Pseudomonadota bacterium]
MDAVLFQVGSLEKVRRLIDRQLIAAWGVDAVDDIWRLWFKGYQSSYLSQVLQGHLTVSPLAVQVLVLQAIEAELPFIRTQFLLPLGEEDSNSTDESSDEYFRHALRMGANELVAVLASKPQSLTEVANELQISPHYARRLMNRVRDSVDGECVDGRRSEERRQTQLETKWSRRREVCRARVHEILCNRPGTGRTAMWGLCKGALLWLNEHDREWLDIHVLTRQGWTSAATASFSQTWTETGADLNLYLAEAGVKCPESAAAAKALLVDVSAWPGDAKALKQEWIRFLIAAGVSDGLISVPAKLPEGPLAGSTWAYYFRTGKYPDLDRTWFLNSGFVDPRHPQTHYWRKGEAWKLPGQAIVEVLSDEARRRFATLAIRHLQSHGRKYLTFSIFRRDRDQRHYDLLTYYTPLATFLATASWFPMESLGAVEFLVVAQGWLITERRSEPRFVSQGAEELAALLRMVFKTGAEKAVERMNLAT